MVPSCMQVCTLLGVLGTLGASGNATILPGTLRGYTRTRTTVSLRTFRALGNIKCYWIHYAGTHVPPCLQLVVGVYTHAFVFALELLKRVAVCPGYIGVEEVEDNVDVEREEEQCSPGPRRLQASAPPLTVAALKAHIGAHSGDHAAHPLDMRKRRCGAAGDVCHKTTVFGYGLTDLVDMEMETLTKLRLACTHWLKHIDLEMQTRNKKGEELRV